jgi:hypothetical protein
MTIRYGLMESISGSCFGPRIYMEMISLANRKSRANRSSFLKPVGDRPPAPWSTMRFG